MRHRNHSAKNQRQREYYSKGIKKLDYEPTLDESLKFQESDDTKADLSLSETNQSRPPAIKDKIADHFRENWIYWAVGGVALLLIFFVFDFNRDMGRVEGKIEHIDESVTNINSHFESIYKKNNEQDLMIKENELRLEFLKENIKNKKSVDKN